MRINNAPARMQARTAFFVVVVVVVCAGPFGGFGPAKWIINLGRHVSIIM